MKNHLSEDVDRIYPGFGFPPIDIDVRPSEAHRLEDFMAALGIDAGDESSEVAPVVLGEVHGLRRQLLDTGRSIRRGSGPETVLHALLLEDGQTLGRVAAKLHKDPRDCEFDLTALVDMGWVQVDDSGPLKRYTLPGIAR